MSHLKNTIRLSEHTSRNFERFFEELQKPQKPQQPTVPLALYKYGNSEHITGFLKTGILQIGTLLYYNDTVGLNKDIGDDKDGQTISLQKTDQPLQLKDIQKNTPVGNAITVLGDGIGNISGIDFKQVNKSIDLYTFCTSYELSNEIPQRSASAGEKPYDACFKINDPIAFMHAILNLPQFSNRQIEMAGYIIYLPEVVDYKIVDQFHPAFVKKKSLAYQKEFRFVIQPLHIEYPLTKKLIVCPEAIEFCEQVDIPQ